ncbi:hypothetical protein [Fibrobacter sp.]|uniref:hypothetical protein n=1 Tax=Fibrobacter sp. TaxID=35828 RepID=UPI0025B96101|nr:hypothetical protein [Fibrobacter sp.]
MIFRGLALASILAVPSLAQTVADSAAAPTAQPVADSVAAAPTAQPVADSVAAAPTAQPAADSTAAAATAQPVADSVAAAPTAQPAADSVAAAPTAKPAADSVAAAPTAQPVADSTVTAATAQPVADTTAAAASTQPVVDSVAVSTVDSVTVAVADTAKTQANTSWTVSGSWGAEFGYHSVVTQKNESGEVFVNGTDSIQPGKKYKNYFQVPGVYAAWNAFVQMESSTGKKFEFTLDATSNNWNRFDPRYVQALYEDRYQKFILGDMLVWGGDLYLGGIDLFGASYDLNIGRDSLLTFSIFGGENRAPKLPYEKDPDMYNQYIGLDEVEAQKMVLGTKALWNASKNVNATIGFIGSKDYLEDPYFRDGTSKDVKLSNPMFSSKTLFSELNGRIMGGRGSYNIQFGLGGADTLNVVAHRAVNSVFESAGLDVSSFAQLRRLMNNTSLVNRMNREELELMFGENTDMSVDEMRTELKRVLKLASEALKQYRKNNDKDPNEWTFQNLALSGIYSWKSQTSAVDAYFRMVGRNYYSAGSPDLLQNSRQMGAKYETKIRDPWKLNVGYEMNIENASGSGDAYNFFGLAEGSKLGFIPGADDDWLKKHEQDASRTLYVHDFELKNTFKIRDSAEVMVRYAFNYRTRSTPQRLHGNFIASSGIYSDPWFAKQSGKTSIDVETDDGVIQIDSARWAKYAALQKEEYLATQFDERLLKHTLELGATIKLPKNVLKVGSVFTFRFDLSKFNQDDLLDDFDFSNKTYGILGYYFHGSDYFEMRIPISLTTTLDKFRNSVTFTPRYRSYNRDDMSEFEWYLSESAAIQLKPNFLDLMLNGSIRQNFMSRQEEKKTLDEMELDLDLSAGLKIQLTERLSNEWTFGAFFNHRPDNESEGYRDIYGSISVNLDF